EPFPEIPGPVPLTTDRASGFYFRKEMEQLLLSPGDVEDIGEDFSVPVDHAIIGWAPGVEGFFVAVGFGGHGFQHSPATGRYVSEWLLDGKSSLDLSLFDP